MEQSLSTANVQFETTIKATKENVWHCLINETNMWWTKDFYTNAKTKGFYIEGRIGGKAYEDYGDGQGLIWAEVIGVDAPNAIHLKGMLAPDFGGPAISYLSIQLTTSEAGTVFNLSDTLFGAVNENTANQISAGWKMIYAEAFKNFVESKS